MKIIGEYHHIDKQYRRRDVDDGEDVDGSTRSGHCSQFERRRGSMQIARHVTEFPVLFQYVPRLRHGDPFKCPFSDLCAFNTQFFGS